MADTAKIATKLVAATKLIDAVEKRGRNTQQNYGYVKATDVANEVRKALIEVGIAFTYSVINERYWESQTKSGTTQFFCSLLVDCTLTDAESGEFISFRCIGWGADSQEKAPYKAMTGALKYALRMNFLIPDESDPEEAVAQESVRQANPTPPSTQQQRPAPAPQQQGRQTGTISEPQSKRFFAIAKQAGKSDDDIRRYIMNVLHIDKSLQMPRDKYEAACKWAENTSPGLPEPEDLGITDEDIPF